ncbi:hypothetical protein POX_d05936 [Penicillium oxalicum]|uniref:hypothetical protein n=1 Tax=Penicillium oxalicum TaxID=69781 RepID=UPI0020B85A80|nr:hypothetical protein POX_d05936 [Penicillium oxalicum]KAI2790423.1 hypothetical protein POX_d05936 [Penicillium oxalicum]
MPGSEEEAFAFTRRRSLDAPYSALSQDLVIFSTDFALLPWLLVAPLPRLLCSSSPLDAPVAFSLTSLVRSFALCLTSPSRYLSEASQPLNLSPSRRLHVEFEVMAKGSRGHKHKGKGKAQGMAASNSAMPTPPQGDPVPPSSETESPGEMPVPLAVVQLIIHLVMMMFTMAAFAQMMAVLVPCQYPGLACSTACYHFGCGCSLLGPALVLFVLFAWSLRHGPRGLSFFSQFAVWSFLWGLRDVLFSNAWAMRSREAQVRPLGQASLGAGDGSSSPGEYVWLDGVSQSILGVNDLERGLSSSQITVDVYVHSVGSNSDSQVHVWSFVRARARINIFGRSWTIVTSATLFSVSLEDHPVVDWKRLRMYSLTIHACFDSSHLLQSMAAGIITSFHIGRLIRLFFPRRIQRLFNQESFLRSVWLLVCAVAGPIWWILNESVPGLRDLLEILTPIITNWLNRGWPRRFWLAIIRQRDALPHHDFIILQITMFMCLAVGIIRTLGYSYWALPS